ncbi:type IX secretion system anionic LPS delivery protein PorZ [Crocinitomix algicola]|uniref:type IX secretion system anionic LPS delivery protein PorZ n=1 Tax=Crocinitomix algicola TaxID=1740263 RepID=UPI000834912E|nr:two-component regulator propeller domain-containing protein [Crocinitomix algicola]
MKKIFQSTLIALVSFVTLQPSFGQIGMNQWRVHFSVNSANGIAKTQDMVYMACANGIIRNDLTDNTVDQLTVANGLSDLGISAIGSDSKMVVIGYVNGNIDLIEGQVITNVPWIEKADLSGDKTVNNFYFDGSTIYIATSIGLVVFDNEKKEIRDTYYPYNDPVVYDVSIFHDTLYAATEKGIYYAHKDKGYLNDFTNWNKFENLPPTVVNSSFKHLEVFEDLLFLGYDSDDFQADTVYYYNNDLVTKMPAPITLKSIYADNDRLIITDFSSVKSYNTALEEQDILFEYNGKTPSPAAAVFAGDKYWIADETHGLVNGTNSWNTSFVYDNTPAYDGCYKLDIEYGKVLVAGGGISQNLVSNSFQNGAYLFEEETWTNFNYRTDPLIIDSLDRDFIGVAINPNNTDEFALSSFSKGGIKVVKDGKSISQVYNAENSLIEDQAGDFMFIPDMKYDNDGNLWYLNRGLKPLKVITATGEEYAFDLGASATNKYPLKLMIDDEGNKWISMVNVGLFAFNENGTLADPSDDQVQILRATEGSGNLPHSYINTICQDADGEIWIGTEEGMVILYSREKLYDGGYAEYDALPILLTVGEETERLLGGSNITAITIDGGNRKWIGTSSSGVFCFSEDGKEEIYRFTAENSPLISNSILDIQIDHLSGEVFFATNEGLVSYRTDASLADNDFEQVNVYPNPVRPDFRGPITVNGLGYESDVKITDISGNLIYQTVSNGGTVIWDGNTLQGDRVQTGVYLVWSGVTSGKGKNVAKILVIN